MHFLSWKESNIPGNSVSHKSDLKILCFSITYHGERGRRKYIYVIVKIKELKDYFVNTRKVSLSIVLWPSMIGTFFYVNHGISQKSANWE